MKRIFNLWNYWNLNFHAPFVLINMLLRKIKQPLKNVRLTALASESVERFWSKIKQTVLFLAKMLGRGKKFKFITSQLLAWCYQLFKRAFKSLISLTIVSPINFQTFLRPCTGGLGFSVVCAPSIARRSIFVQIEKWNSCRLSTKSSLKFWRKKGGKLK